MYELNGQQYTLEQVQNAADQSNLSLDEYISKVGLKKILESSPDFQSPTMPGAVVGDSQAPDMGLGSGSGSLESLVPTEVLLGKPREEKPKPTSFPGALLDKAEELGERFFPEDGYFNSIVQGIKIGSQRASAADEIYNVFKGAKDETSVEEFVDVMQKMNQAPQIESFNKWSASYDKYAEAIKKVPDYNNIKGDLAATLMAIKEEGAAGMFGVFAQSIASMMNKEASREAGRFGVATAGAGAALGTAGGPFAPITSTAGAIGGFFTGSMAGASKMTEQLATFSDMIQQEILENPKKYEGGFNEENVYKVIGDEELFKKFKRRSTARGFAIAGTDFIGTLTGIKALGPVTSAVTKVGGKTFAKVAGTGAVGAIETGSAFGGELLGQKAAGQDIDIKEGIVEAIVGPITGTPSTVITAALGAYRINGEKITKEQALELNELRTPEDDFVIEVDNDPETAKIIDDKSKDFQLEKDIDPELTDKLDRAAVKALESQRQELLNTNTRSGKTRLKKIEDQIDEITDKVTERNKQISDTNQDLVTTIKSEESTSAQIESAKNKLVENNQGIINEVVNNNFNPTLDTNLTKEDFKSEVLIEFSKLINSYNIEKGTPFGAYVKQNLPRRVPGIFDKLVETKVNEETGKKEIVAKQDITDTQIEGEVTTQKEVELDTEKTKSIKNKLFTAKLGFDKKFVPGQTEKTFADIFSEAVAKTFGTSLPEVTNKNFVKEFQKKNRAELTPIIQELMKKDKNTGVDNFKIFLEQNFDAVINQLPQSVINKKYPMLREAVLDEEGKQQREGTPEGKGIFKRVEQEKSDFIDYFTATEDKVTGKKIGSSTRSDRKQSLLRTLVDELSADAALEVTKDQAIMDKFKEVQEVEGKTVPDDFLDVIVKKLDRGIDFLNRLQKNNKTFLLTGVEAAIIYASEIFLKALKLGLTQGKNLTISLNEALKKLNKSLQGKYSEQIIEDVETDVYNKIMNEAKTGEIPSMLDMAEFIANSTGKKSVAYEQAVITSINSSNAEGLSTTKKKANKYGSKNPDVPIKYNGINTNIEVKLNNDAQIGSFSINYDGENFTLPDILPEKLKLKIEKQIIQKQKKLVDNYINRALELGGKRSKSGVRVNKKIHNKLKEEGLQRELSSINIKTNEEILAAMANAENTYYIQIGNQGLFHLGKDILNLGTPKLKGTVQLEFRIRRSGTSKTTGLGSSDLTIVPKLVNFNQKSNKSIDTVDGVNNLFKKEKQTETELNEMLERTKGIPANEKVSVAKAKTRGIKADKFRLFVPFSAEDLLGLLYRFAGKGKQGDADIKWIKETFTRPLTRANLEFEAAQIKANEFLKEAKAIMAEIGVDLTKEAVDGYTVEQAIRVHLWNKRGYDIPGIEKQDIKAINQYIRQNFDPLQFTDAIERAYVNNENKYPEPDENWVSGTLTTDLLEFTNTQTRSEVFQAFYDNVEAAFGKFDKFSGKLSGPTVNKIRSIYGNKFVEALESSLYRIGTGKNRTYQLDKQGGAMLDWLNNAIGNIMFINTRSALLQTISSGNFVNWSDNNPLNAAKAWANQPKFWSYFNKIFFSDYLKSRRSGLRTDVNEQEIATAAANSKNPTRAVIATILKKGFYPTQMADSFAIAFGGSSFLSNREAKYKKEGMSDQDAFDKAFEDMREIAEDTQQSGRPEKISQEQAGFAGRLILAFQNTPMQYNRLIKKAGLDLINRRGDWKTNISKIIYYGGIQNALFYSLQQALFALMFDEPENEKEEKREKERYYRVANGMADSILRGSGVFGALLGTTKNTILKIAEREGFDEKAIEEIFNLSPPIGTKTRKLFDIKDKFTYKQELKKMREMGLDTENPAVLAAGDALSFGINLPADRALRKINNLRAAADIENETWQRIALALGWSKWDVGIPFESTAKPKKPIISKPPPKRKRLSNKNSRVIN
jgi:hypothetical protein